MSTKKSSHKSTNRLDLTRKITIIEEYDKARVAGESMAQVARKHNISKQALSKMLKNREKYNKRLAINPSSKATVIIVFL